MALRRSRKSEGLPVFRTGGDDRGVVRNVTAETASPAKVGGTGGGGNGNNACC